LISNQTLKYPLYLLDKAKFRGGFDVGDTIVISGSPRTGTTWIMETLDKIPGYTTVFEPLHHTWFPESREAGFTLKPYATKGAVNAAMGEYIGGVLSGGVSSRSPQYRRSLGNIMKRLFASKLIVKFVRANRIIPWMLENYEPRGLLYVIRHPCATISSQIRTGYTGYDLYEPYPGKEEVLREAAEIGLDREITGKLEGITSEIEALAAVWAMDQLIPLSNPHPRMYTLPYERLVERGVEEMGEVLSFLREADYLETVASDLNRPSITVDTSVTTTDFRQRSSSWRRNLTEGQIEGISRALSWFDMGFEDEEYTILDHRF